ncbi:MAG: hypothetical protein ACTIJ9_01285 [Aequorivita sp.]
MKIRKMTLIMVFAGLAFSSCKNQDSKKTSTETDKIEVDEGVITPEFENEINDSDLVAKVKDYITSEYLSEADLRAISEDQRTFQIEQLDLNDDGKKEVFVNFTSAYFCGTGGCSVLLLNNQIEPITKFTVTRTPLYIEPTMENGWRPVMTQSEGEWRKLIYKDGSYPSNPSVVEVSSDAPVDGSDILFVDNNTELKTYNF